MIPIHVSERIDMLRRLLQVSALCLATAAIQIGFQPERAWQPPVVYSLFIGAITWFIIDFGRRAFESARETGWPRGVAGVALPCVGIVVGYLAGTWFGDAWFGWSSWDRGGRAQLRVSIAITVLSGAGITYYFYAKNRGLWLEINAKEARRQASEAKLKLLETQLEPHMLFNTLANLRALIATDTPRALSMLDRLDSYLRATLAGSRATTHPLAQEFARVADYLELMAVRMGPRLAYTLTLPPELARAEVPPLILQPLVENAIRHGLEPKIEGGAIRVTARRRTSDAALEIEVADTSVGLSRAMADAVQATDPTDAHAGASGGFGLTQIRERLNTLYGDQAAIETIATEDRGYWALLRFPHKT